LETEHKPEAAPSNENRKQLIDEMLKELEQIRTILA
jgi:hypothetical protein